MLAQEQGQEQGPQLVMQGVLVAGRNQKAGILPWAKALRVDPEELAGTRASVLAEAGKPIPGRQDHRAVLRCSDAPDSGNAGVPGEPQQLVLA